jgi:hypothetical protein
VSPVKRRHLGHSEPFRDCDEAGIGSTEWPVVVQLDELRHALVVSSGNVDRDQSARREQPQERRFALAARSSLKQVTDFRRNGRRVDAHHNVWSRSVASRHHRARSMASAISGVPFRCCQQENCIDAAISDGAIRA